MQKNKLKIFVFINDSLGELDWIAPFMKRAASNDYFFICI